MSSGTELFNLKGKRALITGSSQGIGFALAKGLDEAGAEIILNGRNKEKLDKAAKALTPQNICINYLSTLLTKMKLTML